MNTFDIAIIGAGQAGLATAWHLRRSGANTVLLDANSAPGGSWQHTWDSLSLFSPGQHSSLPGWLMPYNGYPTRDEVVDYLTRYENRYQFQIHRPVSVLGVVQKDDHFQLQTTAGDYAARAVVSATGTFGHPFVPDVAGLQLFEGTMLHSAQYKSPDRFIGKRVLVVGGGNSGAQIMAEISTVCNASWVTLDQPNWLPPEVDGRYLFDLATARYIAHQKGEAEPDGPDLATGLSSIVQVPSVQKARAEGRLASIRPFQAFWEKGVEWGDGAREAIDAVIWCTGFKAALDHLKPLGIVDPRNRIKIKGTRAMECPGVWLVGYGNWTGFASATLIGVGRTARATAKDVQRYLLQP